MIKRFIIIGLLLALASACSSGNNPALTPTTEATALPKPTNTPTPIPPTETPTRTPTPTQAATATPIAYGPDNFPEDINPLTGLAVGDQSLLERRPVSVKVQIFPRGQRPPWGVTEADIVYDYYQNLGMTRFHAIFYGSNAEQAGPIRSARLLDYHLVNMYESILAFGGADQRIRRRLFSADFADRLVVEGSGNCPPLCRTDPNGYNFLMVDTGEMTDFTTEKGIDNSSQNLDGMSFNPEPPENGKSGKQLFVRFSISAYNRWDYDPENGRYWRFQDTQEDTADGGEVVEPMVDGLSGEQISADNVVILFATHQYAFNTKPGNSEIIDILLSGSGTAYAFRDGQIYEVQWNRPTTDSVIFLTTSDGSRYEFKPGNTWFQVIGKSSAKLQSMDGDAWRFHFSIP